jgi:hypothetical protein
MIPGFSPQIFSRFLRVSHDNKSAIALTSQIVKKCVKRSYPVGNRPNYLIN